MWVVHEMTTKLKTIDSKTKNTVNDFVAYSVVVDETIDTTDMAQLAFFVCGVETILFIMEVNLDIKSMHGATTGKELFEEIFQSVTDMKLPWDKLVELTTDGALVICSEKSGFSG